MKKDFIIIFAVSFVSLIVLWFFVGEFGITVMDVIPFRKPFFVII